MTESFYEVCTELAFVRGKPMKTRDYKLFQPFFDSTAKRNLIKAGRQIGKSTSLAILIAVLACLKEYYGFLSILPLQNQSYKFSRSYVSPVLEGSPCLNMYNKKAFANTIGYKRLSNGAELHFTYLGDNPDRIRGTSVQDIKWDEIQDINFDFIAIAEECAAAYPEESKFSYTGTPKTLDNTLESLWGISSQQEPFLTCTRCGHHNYCLIPDIYKMIREDGLSCQKCQKVLEPDSIYNPRYDCLFPSKVDEFNGFHIPQIFIPFNLTPKAWKSILYKYYNYGKAQFANEVLGISYDSGGKPITLQKLKECCLDYTFRTVVPNRYVCKVMGVDWGTATSDSYSALAILGKRHDGKVELVFGKKFKYRDRLEQHREILQYFVQYGCSAFAGDHGIGFTDNLIMREHLGVEKVYEFYYVMSRRLLKYVDEKMYYTTSKAQTLGILFTELNKGNILFPKFELMEDLFRDILAVYEESRSTHQAENKFYDKRKGTRDDFLHALNFANLGLKLLTEESILSGI